MRRHLLRSGFALAATCLAVLVMSGSALAASIDGGAWRWQNPLPQGSGYSGGYFLDATHGWLVSGGTIFHTTDGGLTVTVQARHNVDLRAITFVGARHGWAVGYPANVHRTAILYRTVNGGHTWTRIPLQWRGHIGYLSFATTEIGWATIGRLILHTTDGGRSWTSHLLGRRDNPGGVAALSTRRAWVADGGNTLLHTVDGGRTWARVHVADVVRLSLVVFKGSSYGWAASNDARISGGQIIHTTDGGRHWTVQLSAGGVGSLSFADRDNGWATVREAVYHTTDGGADWAPQPAAFSADWVAAPTPFAAVTGGSWELKTGRLSRTTDGGATWQSSVSAAGDYFGTLTALQFTDAQDGWAVGGGGAILATSNGGAAWTAQTSNTNDNLTAVRFVDAANGWVVGDQGSIVHTSDGGATWTAQTSNTSFDLTGVTFVDAQDGWATGQNFDDDYSSGLILHTTDGGQHWTTQYASLFATNTGNPGVAFSAVAFADSQHGWAVGETAGPDMSYTSSVIMHTTNGGATWTRQLGYEPPDLSNSGSATLTSVACTDARHAVAVGYDENRDEIWRTTTGGATWSRVAKKLLPLWLPVGLSDVVFADATHGWAVGEGTIIHTTDGGATWTKQFAPSSLNAVPLDALSFVSPKQGWAAGAGGDILKTTTGGNAP